MPKVPGQLYNVYKFTFKKEVWNEVGYLTALAGSNTTLRMYYTSNFLTPLSLFFSIWNPYQVISSFY